MSVQAFTAAAEASHIAAMVLYVAAQASQTLLRTRHSYNNLYAVKDSIKNIELPEW